jgi:GTP:adenosylcobinamide-phosphate guanylyltransferase
MSMPASQITALILAGSRAGEADPMAAMAGVAHKALIEVTGTPMILRVIAALRASRHIGRIMVATESADLLAGYDQAAGVIVRPAAASPAASVACVLAECGAPLLVTTADHALLTGAMVDYFLAHAPAADAVAAVARHDVILAAYPDTRRTWMRLRDGNYSGCNLFLLATPAAAHAVSFWRTLEQHRKSPLTMARLAGPATLLRYAARRLTMAGALRALSRRSGARLAVVALPFAEAAIDVDKPADLALAEAALARREAA